jgi:hypothetical protein
VLAGALGIAALTACDVDDLRPPEDEATPTAAPTSSVTPEPDADARLAEDVAYEMSAALVYVEDARRSFPRLGERLRPLLRMHRTHLEVLVPPDGRSVPAPQPSGTPAEALALLFAVEDALQRRLAASAVAAQSGALARLLASLSASVAQHVHAHLPPPPVEGGPR